MVSNQCSSSFFTTKGQIFPPFEPFPWLKLVLLPPCGIWRLWNLGQLFQVFVIFIELPLEDAATTRKCLCSEEGY